MNDDVESRLHMYDNWVIAHSCIFSVWQVAKKLKDEGLSATYAVANKNDFSHEMEEFGLAAAGDKPVVAAK